MNKAAKTLLLIPLFFIVLLFQNCTANNLTSSTTQASVDSINGLSNLRDLEVVENTIYNVDYHSTTEDQGGGSFIGVTGRPAGTFTDNNGTVVVPKGGDGSSAFIRDYSGKIQFEWFGAVNNGVIDNSDAWAEFLIEISKQKIGGAIGSGTYFIESAPGQVLDSSVHNTPELNLSWVDIECAPGARILAAKDTTPERANTYVTRPILKLVSSDGELFKWTGCALDGNVATDADLGGSLGSGNFPNVAPMLEVRGFERVHLELEATKFAQNWDKRTPELGNGWRRGPILIWGNGEVTGDVSLRAPTRREGIAFGNNRSVDVFISFYGNPDLTSEGNVSSPFNFVSGSPDIPVGGEFVKIKLNEWSGAWTGSAINIYSPGEIIVDLKNKTLAGGNDGLNTATGTSAAKSGGGVFGKGIDIGHEISYGTTERIEIRNGTVKDAFQYSLLINRTEEHEVEELVFDNVLLDGGWRGLISSYAKNINGNIEVKRMFQYNPTDDRMGVGLTIKNTDAGRLEAQVDTTGQGPYSAPNLATPIASGIYPAQKALESQGNLVGFEVVLSP